MEQNEDEIVQSPEDLVNMAIIFLEQWKQDQSKDYLISAYAMAYLNKAMRKLRFDDAI